MLCTNSRPSRIGTPMWSVNSTGAAPVPPSLPSTTMKSGRMPVSSMALAMPMNSHGWPRQNLKPTGLPPDSSRSCWMKCISSIGVENALCARRRDAVFAHQDAAGVGDFLGDLVLGQDPAMAGLGALAHLDLDHPHLRRLRLCGEAFRVEAPVGGAAAEVAAAELPGQVAAVFAVIGADAAFAGVVGEVAELGALVQRANGVGAERAEAHGRDVEHRRRVRLRALRAADGDAETAAGRSTAPGASNGR